MMSKAILVLKSVLIVLLIYLQSNTGVFAALTPRQEWSDAVVFYGKVLLSLFIFILVLDVLRQLTVSYYRRRHKISGTDNFILGTDHIYNLLLVIGFILGFLSLFKINIVQLFTSLSIIFAGLAILFKEYISNMLNGMIFTFSGQLNLNDQIRIGDHKGHIIDITLQNIHLLNDDDDIIYIPNNMVMNTDVINYTKRLIKRNSIEFNMDLKLLDSIESLEAELVNALKPYEQHIREDSYYLRVVEMRKDSLRMKFQYILKEPNKTMERDIRKMIIRKLATVMITRIHQSDSDAASGTS